jgi:5-formyltetrahydrofolate cyclo-ligase
LKQPFPPPIEPEAIAEAKTAARHVARARRLGIDPALGTLLAANLFDDPKLRSAHIVGGFWPLPEEIDIRPLLHALHDRRQRICLPVTGRRGHPLTFHEWHPETELSTGRFGTSHPDGARLIPDLLLMPLLGFDRQGTRLGYGGGYYDRTFDKLSKRPRLVGIAFAAQELDEIPRDAHDVPLDLIITEHGARSFAPAVA